MYLLDQTLLLTDFILNYKNNFNDRFLIKSIINIKNYNNDSIYTTKAR